MIIDMQYIFTRTEVLTFVIDTQVNISFGIDVLVKVILLIDVEFTMFRGAGALILVIDGQVAILRGTGPQGSPSSLDALINILFRCTKVLNAQVKMCRSGW